MHATSAQTLALAVGLGALVSLLCARARVPAVLPLLLAGFALGKSGFGLVDGDALGTGLGALVSVSIGLLIFEGGLHLSGRELAKAPRAIPRLLTIGAFVTAAGVALAARFIVGVPWPVAVIIGAALIVTGPTVVQPILRRVRLTPALHTSLAAEAILIDPIGVAATVIALDVMLESIGAEPRPIGHFLLVYSRMIFGGVFVGLLVGAAARGLVAVLSRNAPLSASGLNLVAITSCMVAVGLGEWMAPEGGLVAATICAVVLANLRTITVRDVHEFHEQVSGLLVGTLFILIASRVELASLRELSWRDAAFVAAVILVVRPLCVGISTIGSPLTGRERLFAAFMGPRGIVAASVAALAADRLAHAAPPGSAVAAIAGKVETLVLLVIITTVTICASLAAPVARALGVAAGTPGGLLIVGAHRLGVALGAALQAAGVRVTLVDANEDRAALAESAGLRVLRGDATDAAWMEETALTPDLGWVLAWTGNPVVDRVVARWAAARLGAGRGKMWTAEGLADPAAAAPGVSGLRPLLDLVAAVDRGATRVSRASSPAPTVLATIDGARVVGLGRPITVPARHEFLVLEDQTARPAD